MNEKCRVCYITNFDETGCFFQAGVDLAPPPPPCNAHAAATVHHHRLVPANDRRIWERFVVSRGDPGQQGVLMRLRLSMPRGFASSKYQSQIESTVKWNLWNCNISDGRSGNVPGVPIGSHAHRTNRAPKWASGRICPVGISRWTEMKLVNIKENKRWQTTSLVPDVPKFATTIFKTNFLFYMFIMMVCVWIIYRLGEKRKWVVVHLPIAYFASLLCCLPTYYLVHCSRRRGAIGCWLRFFVNITTQSNNISLPNITLQAL